MVLQNNQCENVGRISRTKRAVSVDNQGIGNYNTTGKQIAYRGLFPRKTGVSSAEKTNPETK